MTKDEIKREAEEFADSKRSFWRQGKACIESVIQAYIAGAEPREKRIAELEKENAELKNRDCWKSCEYANPKAELIGQHIKDVQNLTKAKN